MAMSGVTCDDNAVEAFKDQKLRKTCKVILYKLSDNKKHIEIEAQKDSDWDTFAAELPEKECRYATYDFHHVNNSGRIFDKLVFVAWCPDAARVGEKMLFASSKDAIKKKLQGLAFELQGNDRGDLKMSEVIEKVEKTANE